MTPAERKSRSRNDQERRDLVARYIAVVRRGLPDIVGIGALRDKARTGQRKWMRQLRDDLFALSLEALRDAVAVLKETPDLKGRLRNERSGEGNRTNGMSELERIINARDRDENGRRVRPAGAAPVGEDADVTADPVDTTTPECIVVRAYVLSRLNSELAERAKEQKMAEVTRQLFLGDEQEPTAEFDPTATVVRALRCRLCGFSAGTWSEAERHIWSEFGKGWKVQDHYLKLSDLNVEGSEDLIGEARRRVIDDRHFVAITTLFRRRSKPKRIS